MEKFTSFAEAIKANNMLAVKEMLDENPTLIHSVTPEGMSVIMLAAYYRYKKLLEVLVMRKRRLDVFEASAAGALREVERNVDKDKRNIIANHVDGYSPLHLASWFGHPDIVKYLIQKGAPVNGPANNESKVTPLHSAVASMHFETVQLLLKLGADINAKQKDDNTPLHSAAHNGHAAMVKLLVENNAKKDARNSEGKTPADLAREKKFDQIVDYLEGRLVID